MERRIGIKRYNVERLRSSLRKTSDGSRDELRNRLTFYVFFLLLAVAILMFPVWHIWQSYIQIKTIDQQLKNVVILEGTYLYCDEALTMSLNMAAATGDKIWIDRCENLEKRMSLTLSLK